MPNLIEDKDYMLVPVDDEGNQQAWAVRLLEGPHPETVIRLGSLKVGDDEMLHFNFTIDTSPNLDLTTDDVELQQYVGDVLESILEIAVKEGALARSDDID